MKHLNQFYFVLQADDLIYINKIKSRLTIIKKNCVCIKIAINMKYVLLERKKKEELKKNV